MKALFFQYASLRLRLFLREILELHQRFLLGFLLFFGFILSGNEQLMIREAFAHLLSNQPARRSDWGVLSTILLYSWIVAAAVRKSARGGRVRYLAESLPLPFAWERAVRVGLLNVVNLTVIVLFGMGWGQLIQNQGNIWLGLILALGFYAWLLGLQLSLLERSWRSMPLFAVGAGILTGTRGGFGVVLGFLITAAMIYSQWKRNESRLHDHPGWSIQHLRARIRSDVIWNTPASLQMQIAYGLVKPGALFYILLAGFGVNLILYMVLKQDVPRTQKIYVYACGTGFLGLMLSSFFRNFHLVRQEWQQWLRSLPRPPAWWIRQDTIFVGALYALAVIPLALILIRRQYLGWTIPIIVLCLHVLGGGVMRRVQRSTRLEAALFLMIGSVLWFLLIGYIVDHLPI